ncbi:hypothetical protein BV25DRAFT_1920602 [Artomyces pyxidatus]|uniref:Uncharacterized protein n=1 Tax=Artomyces pyxidatus TaxID=48021 RepID=A0ACB8SKU5_9AGAM|nr:hypothetical protein BV25DRAFT_1920602 [Artomyces pyxidatus]
MFHDISWNMGALVASWVVGPLYGINICVFVLCLRVLHLKGLRGANLALFMTAVVQFLISTGHVITLLVQLIRGFITSATTLDGPAIYFLNQATEHIAQEMLYISNSLIGDAILIWRLYIIWGRNIWLTAPFVTLLAKVVLTPVAFCIATGICGYTAVANVAQLNDTGSIFISRIHNWLLATWALSIATQFGATLLIAYKIWASVSWNAFGVRGSRLSILWILVESGAAYSVTTIFLLGFSKTNVGAIFVASLGQISAIAPTLIVVRTGLKSSQYLSPSSKGSINDIYNHTPRRSVFKDISGKNDESGATIIHITKATQIHLDDVPDREPMVSFHPLYPSPKAGLVQSEGSVLL